MEKYMSYNTYHNLYIFGLSISVYLLDFRDKIVSTCAPEVVQILRTERRILMTDETNVVFAATVYCLFQSISPNNDKKINAMKGIITFTYLNSVLAPLLHHNTIVFGGLYAVSVE
jgi:hypothetical protein